MSALRVELQTPPSGEIKWVGWPKSNPNRVGRAHAKLWFDAREIIMRELGISDLGEVEVIKCES